MKRLSALICSLLLLTSCRAAQTDDNTLLWKISGNGLANTSFLFGTMHMICPDDYIWTDAMKKSLAQCRQVCFELDMDDPQVLTKAASGLTSKEDKSLKEYFTQEQWTRLHAFMKDSIGVDISMMQMMPPMMLETVLATKLMSCSFPASYEANIMEQAHSAKQEVVGIEDVQEQIDVFNSMPADSVVSSLMETVDSFSKTKAEYAKMITAYKQQDLKALHQLVSNSDELKSELGAFLDDRNKKWIPRMSEMMHKQSTFFAVGAGHLWGDAGVIALLRKAGYTVTPMH